MAQCAREKDERGKMGVDLPRRSRQCQMVPVDQGKLMPNLSLGAFVYTRWMEQEEHTTDDETACGQHSVVRRQLKN